MARLTTKPGEELSRDDLDALAAEAERGYDLTGAKRTRPGRPSLSGDGVSPRVQIRVEPELAEALRARARSEKRSVSDVARAALRRYVDSS